VHSALKGAPLGGKKGKFFTGVVSGPAETQREKRYVIKSGPKNTKGREMWKREEERPPGDPF